MSRVGTKNNSTQLHTYPIKQHNTAAMLLSAAALVFLPLTLAMQPFDSKLIAANRMSIHLTDAASGNCSARVEDSPWLIKDVISLQAHPGSKNVSSTFTFSFEDINAGLELKTNCTFALPRGSNASIADDRYHLCTGGDVRFKYDGQLLQVSRWYQDPCLGPPPYDSAIAHGRANLSLTKTQAPYGELATQTEVQIPISGYSWIYEYRSC
ncbi:unnamed protein product [Cercospora beticola]|nr:unnamed protein product [Cercospora beticola]